jgi:biotin carboxyl carrier protein
MTIWLEIGGRTRKVEIPASSSATGEQICILDGRTVRVNVQMLQQGAISLQLAGEAAGETRAGRKYRCVLETSAQGDAVVVDGQRVEFAGYDPRSLRARRGAVVTTDGPRTLKSPMPGRVMQVLVAEGDTVQAQQGLVIVEAMKMQNELKSPKAGRVTRVATQAGDSVQTGDLLFVVG